MDNLLKEWVMISLAKKWKDFKGKMKEKWYNTREIDEEFWNGKSTILLPELL